MRFVIGLIIGLGIGTAAALLMAPQRGRLRETAESGEEEPLRERLGLNHDSMQGVRRAMGRLQEQVQEAWEEARKAAHEAEQEMRARYERSIAKDRQ